MTVIRPNSVAGINSITAQASVISLYDVDGNLVNIAINNLVGVAATFTSVNVTGIVSATSFKGDGSQLSGVGGENDITSSLFI